MNQRMQEFSCWKFFKNLFEMMVHAANATKIAPTNVRKIGIGKTPTTQTTIKNATNNTVFTLFRINPILIF